MIEELVVKIQNESLVISATDEDKRFIGEFTCTKQLICELYPDDDEDSRFLRNNWLVQSFYILMSEVTDYCGASFTNEDEENRFMNLLTNEKKLLIKVHMSRQNNPFVCVLEVQMSRKMEPNEVFYKFYWDELK